MDAKSVLLVLFCVAGIYSAYLTQGVLSEQLATRKYGENSERFNGLQVINGAQSFVCFVVSGFILLLWPGKRSGASKAAPWHAYWKAGITNSLGPALGMEALKNISYSAQVLVKSCKMVPVMLIGTLLHGKRYSTVEYLCVGLITTGISIFAGSKVSKAAESKLVSPNAATGYLLCLVNLLMDGYTNAAQDEINRVYKGNGPIHMMCWMNAWGSLYLGLYSMLVTRAGWDMLDFCIRHPQAGWDALLFCLCGAWGQLFIFFTIRTFGSLINTMICTTRKFFNILLSAIYLSSPLAPNQWLSVALVFIGLLVNSFWKDFMRRRARQPVSVYKKTDEPSGAGRQEAGSQTIVASAASRSLKKR